MERQRKAHFSNDQVAQVKSMYSVFDACSDFGIPVSGFGSHKTILCPNPAHQDKHTGSCMYDPRSGKFFCFSGCGKSYDALDIVRFNLGCDFTTAIQFMANQVGVILVDENAPENIRKQPEKKEYLRLSKTDAEMLGLSINRTRIKMPLYYTNDKDEASSWKDGYSYLPGNEYMDMSKYRDKDDDTDNSEIDGYILYDTATSPGFSFASDDPVAYTSLVLWKIDEQLSDIMDAVKVMWNDTEFIEEAKKRYSHLFKLRKKFYAFYKKICNEPLYGDDVPIDRNGSSHTYGRHLLPATTILWQREQLRKE